MSGFFVLQEQMGLLLTGDMARETLHMAEDQFYLNREEFEEELAREAAEIKARIDPCVSKNWRVINGKHYEKFIGGEHNACWNKGDFYFNSAGDLVQVPDSWEFEDLRHDEIIYRPAKH